MRTSANGEWTRSPALQAILGFFLLFVFLFWVTNFLMFSVNYGFSAGSIAEHVLGKPDPWGGEAVPVSYKVLLEVTHAHAFAIGILLLTLLHLLIYVNCSSFIKQLLTIATFSSGFLDLISGWLIRYVAPHFAWLKLIAFSLFQIGLGAIWVMIAWTITASYLASKKQSPS